MNTTLDRLKELAQKPIPLEVYFNGRVSVKTDKGAGEGFPLVDLEEVSIFSWKFNGETLESHSHAEREWLFVLRGEIRVMADGLGTRLEKDEEGRYILTAGDYIYIPSGSVHSAYFPVYTETITLHIPRSSDLCQTETT